MRKITRTLIIPVALAATFFLGPQPNFPPLEGKIQPYEGTLRSLADDIAAIEAQVAGLKPGNEARIFWADSTRRTPYSVVFLHGFSASPREGDPVVREFARRYGCNVYYPRLAGHGIADPEAFLSLRPQDLVNSAREAIAVGQLLGEKVIVMGSSTGCTLGAYLAAENPDAIAALFFYSPNFAIANGAAFLLSRPWGAQLARLTHGGSNYHSFEPEVPEIYDYWTTTYRIEGLVCLQSLLDQTMRPEVFQRIRVPVFVGYYYKNDQEKDPVISVSAIHEFMSAIATPEAQRRAVPLPNVGSHVITCNLQCRDIESVQDETSAFAEQVLRLKPWE